MLHKAAFIIALLLLSAFAVAQEQDEQEPRTISGMSIVGNHEAPKALVIVPWKTSELGQRPGLSSEALDASATPVDREVFMRELSYYRIRSGEGSDR